MNEEIQRIRAGLWAVHEELVEDGLDADEAEARTGVLDSLIELVKLESHAECDLRTSPAVERLERLAGGTAHDDS